MLQGLLQNAFDSEFINIYQDALQQVNSSGVLGSQDLSSLASDLKSPVTQTSFDGWWNIQCRHLCHPKSSSRIHWFSTNQGSLLPSVLCLTVSLLHIVRDFDAETKEYLVDCSLILVYLSPWSFIFCKRAHLNKSLQFSPEPFFGSYFASWEPMYHLSTSWALG